VLGGHGADSAAVIVGAIAVLVAFVVESGLWARADRVVRIVSITACDSNTVVVDSAGRRVVVQRETVAIVAGRTLC